MNLQPFHQSGKSIGGGAGNPDLDWPLFKARTASNQTHDRTGPLNCELPVGRHRHLAARGARARISAGGGKSGNPPDRDRKGRGPFHASFGAWTELAYSLGLGERSS